MKEAWKVLKVGCVTSMIHMRNLLNSKIFKLKESATLALNAAAKALQQRGIDVINLTAGELEVKTPTLIQQVVKNHLYEDRYTPVLGFPELRTEIAKYCTREYRFTVIPSQVGVTAGAKQALYEALRVIIRSGDEVLIPIPGWVSYEEQVRLAGGKPVFCPLDEHFDLDMSEIKKRISRRTKAIILNSPHNPTGAVFSKEHLRQLAHRLNNKSIFWIVDDIYSTLTFNRYYQSPAHFVPDKNYLILVNGFSKSHALTGWRIGYVVAHPEIIRAIGAFQSHTSGNPSLPAQHAGFAALKSYGFTRRMCGALRRNRDFAARELSRISNISFTLPQGAFYFFIDIRKIERDAVKFCQKFLEEKHVALVPGDAFGASGYVRLSFTAPRAALTKGLHRLGEFCKHISSSFTL